MKLLLVEDDFDLSGVLSRSLSSRGFELLCCSDGVEALAAARKKSFDIIVLDLSLPGLDGLELLHRLRGDGNATPVLVLTARGAVGDRIAGLNAGADDYLAKPFDLEELIARVGALTLVTRPYAPVSSICAYVVVAPIAWSQSASALPFGKSVAIVNGFVGATSLHFATDAHSVGAVLSTHP